MNFGPRWSQRELQSAEVHGFHPHLFDDLSSLSRTKRSHVWKILGSDLLESTCFFWGSINPHYPRLLALSPTPASDFNCRPYQRNGGGISATYHISNSGAFAHREHCGFWGVFFCDFKITYPCTVESNRFKTYKTIQNLYDKYIAKLVYNSNNCGL